MLVHVDTREKIEKILSEAFLPLTIEVIDDSAAHHKHKEAMQKPSAGHFKLIMKSSLFDNMTMVKRHRMVYEKLGDMMKEEIHALSMQLYGSNEGSY